MKTIETKRMSGRRERRPSASRMPSGHRDQAGVDREEEGQHQPAPFAGLDDFQPETAIEQPDAERRQDDRVAIASSLRRGSPRHESAAPANSASSPSRSTRQRSGTGYWPYMNCAKRARMKTQQAPPSWCNPRAMRRSSWPRSAAIAPAAPRRATRRRGRAARPRCRARSRTGAAAGRRASRAAEVPRSSSRHQPVARIVPVHEGRHGEPDGEIDAQA